MTTEIIVWAVLLVAFLVLEGLTAQLTSIWFAAGALVALAVTFLGAEPWLEILCFIAVTALTLIFTRPLVRKRLQPTKTPTNADRNIGRIAVVTEQIDNLLGGGSVKVSGVLWTARSVTGETIAQGETVKIVRIDGVKLLVEPVPASEIGKQLEG